MKVPLNFEVQRNIPNKGRPEQRDSSRDILIKFSFKLLIEKPFLSLEPPPSKVWILNLFQVECGKSEH